MKVINAVSRWLGYIGVTLIVMLMLLIAANVFMRFVFNNPITGTPELAALTMACLALGTAWGALKGRHITVDIFVARFPPKVRAIIDSITILASLGIFVTLTWRVVMESIWTWRINAVASLQMPVRTFFFWEAYALGLAMFCVVVVTILIQKMKDVRK